MPEGNRTYIAKGRLLDAGHRAATAQNFPKKRRLFRGRRIDVVLRIIWVRQPGLDGEDTRRIKSETRIQQVPKTVKEKTGGHEEDEGECEFSHHQRSAGARLLPRTR